MIKRRSTHRNTLAPKHTVWSLLIVVCIGVTGCAKELDLTSIQSEPAPVYMSVSAKLLNINIVGNQINTLRVILVDPNANNSIKVNEFIRSPADPLVIPAMTGKYDVYVVANEDANNGKNVDLSKAYSLSTLYAVGLSSVLPARDLSNIPMFCGVKNVVITAAATGDPSPTNLASVSVDGGTPGTTLPVEFERMASKVSIKIISKNRGLAKAKISGIPNVIPLFGDAPLSSIGFSEKDLDPSSFVLTESADNAKHILECKDILVPSWTPTSITDENSAMRFEFTTPLGETLVTSLGHLISGAAKDYSIKRNHNYQVTITVIDRVVFAVVTLEPWVSVGDNLEVQ